MKSQGIGTLCRAANGRAEPPPALDGPRKALANEVGAAIAEERIAGISP